MAVNPGCRPLLAGLLGGAYLVCAAGAHAASNQTTDNPKPSAPRAVHPLASLQPGHWYMAPNSHLRAVAPNPQPPGWTGITAVMTTWSGGAFDTLRNRLIIWGGGHADYSGNEIYAFDVASLNWQRINNPASRVDPGDTIAPSGYYPDAAGRPDPRQPRARHTYDYLEYLPPPVDRFCSLGAAALWRQGAIAPNVDCFNFSTLRWETQPDTRGFGYGAISAYDPVTGHAWVHGTVYDDNSVWAEYDFTAKRWTVRSEPENEITFKYHMTAEIDPVRRKIVAIGEGEVYVWDISQSTGNVPRTILPTSGATAMVSTGSPGLVYDPQSDRLVAWHGGADVYTLNLDSRVWTRIAPAPGNTVIPTAAPEQGTFGRFRYVPAYNVFVAVNSVDENVYFYKLSGAKASSIFADDFER